jgi:hypothetical protein
MGVTAPAVSQSQSPAGRSVPLWIDIMSGSSARTHPAHMMRSPRREPHGPCSKNRRYTARSTAAANLSHLALPSEALVGGNSLVRKNQLASLATPDHMFNSARQKLAGYGPIVDFASPLKEIPGDLN